MADKTIAATIELAGEKEYRQAVTQCTKSLTLMKSEMKLVTAETAGNANSLQSLQKKHVVLQKALQLSKEKQEAVQKGLNHAQDDYEKVGKELAEYRTRAEEAQKALDALTASGTASDEEVREQTAQVANLNATVAQEEDVYEKAGARVKDWETRLNNAKVETINASAAVDENAALMQEAEESADGLAHSIDEYGKKVKDAGSAANDSAACTASFADSIGKLQVAEKISEYLNKVSEAAQELATASYEAAKELDDTYDTIITKTGASGDALGDLKTQADDIFGKMAVEADEVGAAIGEVNTRFHSTGEELEDTAVEFLKFAKINETDVSGSIDQVDKLMDQFGVDTKDTGKLLGLLTKEAQDTGIGMDTLMGSLGSNSATLQDLGFNLAQSADLLAKFEANGVDAGAAAKGLKTAVQNAAKEGLDARQVLDRTITSIQKATSETDAIRIATETFGSKGAQVMARSIRDGRLSLEDLIDSMEDYGDVVNDTYEATLDPWDRMTVLTNNLKLAGSDLAGEFLTTVEPGIEAVTGAVKAGTKFFKELPKPVKQVTTVMVGLTAAAGIAVPKMVAFYSTIKAMKDMGAVSMALKALTTEQVTYAGAAQASAVATEAQTAATAGAETATVSMTAAQTGLNTAMAAMPVIAVVAGLGALAVAFDAAKKKAMENNESLQNVSGSADRMTSALSGAMDSLNTTMEGASRSLQGVESQAALAEDLCDELQDLEKQSDLTTDEQARLENVVAKLNALYPELALEIDKTNGKLNKGSEEIRDYVSNAKKIGMIKAYQRAAEDGFDAIVEAQSAVTDAEKECAKITEEVERLQKDYNRSMKDGAQAQTGYKGGAQSATAETIAAGNALYEATKRQKEASEALESAKAQLGEAESVVDGYISKQNELTDAYGSLTEAAGENAAAQSTQQAAQQLSIEKANEAYGAYQTLSGSQQQMAVDFTNKVVDMTQSIQSALSSQMSMFEEFDAGTAMSTDQMLKNMQSQIDGVANWEKNMAELADRGINTDLLQHLASMGPEGAAYVQTFTNMSSEELAKANDLWSQSMDMQGMTDEWGQQLLESGSANIAASMEGIAGVMEESGANTALGLARGILQASGEAAAAGDELGTTTIDTVNTALGVHSPSDKTMASGRNLDLGLALGMTQNIGLVTAAGQSVANAIDSTLISAFTGTASRIRSAGQSVGQSLSAGINAGTPQALKASQVMALMAGTQLTNSIRGQHAAVLAAGLSVPTGMAQGMNSGRGTVLAAGLSVAQAAGQSAAHVRSYYGSMYSAGRYLDQGLAAGIRDGGYGVQSAVRAIARAAVSAARSELDIHSPSGVGKWIGKMFDAGIAGGVSDNATLITKAVEGSLEPMTRPAAVSAVSGPVANSIGGQSFNGLTAADLYAAVKAGMEAADIGIYLNERQYARTLKGMGVAFA